MRLFLILSVLYSTVIAQTLTIEQQTSLQTYNHKPSLKRTVEKRMIAMTKIPKENALDLAYPYCKEENVTIRLSHHKAYLFYFIKGESCDLRINALDGSLISKELLYD